MLYSPKPRLMVFVVRFAPVFRIGWILTVRISERLLKAIGPRRFRMVAEIAFCLVPQPRKTAALHPRAIKMTSHHNSLVTKVNSACRGARLGAVFIDTDPDKFHAIARSARELIVRPAMCDMENQICDS